MARHYVSTKEAAEYLGLTTRQVTNYCVNGEFPGAVKEGRSWKIPVDYVIPGNDVWMLKESEVKYEVPEGHSRAMVDGSSSYINAERNYHLVDKTLLIRDVLLCPSEVLLFTRPRRFGKSLNLDMLRLFFEKMPYDTSLLFRNKKIWKAGSAMTQEQGKYPVIYLDFKEASAFTFDEMMLKFKDYIAGEYQRHEDLLSSILLNNADRRRAQEILDGNVDSIDVERDLYNLCRMLATASSQPCFVLIDEYDVPMESSREHDYYDRMNLVVRNMLSSLLKGNPYLKKGILTGVLQVAKASLFSGLNNVRTYSILDEQFSEYFGFTESEIDEILSYYGMMDRKGEVDEWYDGYLFGGRKIYNCLSVALYINSGGNPGPYWVKTATNSLIGDMLADADSEVFSTLTDLLNGKEVDAIIDTSRTYDMIGSDIDDIFSLLAISGYLRVRNPIYVDMPGKLCQVSIPNREIRSIWTSEILNAFSCFGSVSAVASIKKALVRGDAERLRENIHSLLVSSVSYFDTAKECFYHGLVLGMVSVLSEYKVKSNRESGNGRFDIMLIPASSKLPGIVIELKARKDSCTREMLAALAETAKEQVISKDYFQELRDCGTDRIIVFGMAFSGKDVEVVSAFA